MPFPHETEFNLQRADIHDLEHSSPNERQNYLKVAAAMLPFQPHEAAMMFSNIVMCVGEDLLGKDRSNTYREEFTAVQSLALLRNSPLRLRGFGEAIRTASFPEGSPIVDIGTGSAAVLALLAANAHPNSPITAFEINNNASMLAEKVVRFLGLQDQIRVVTADYLRVEPVPAGMVVSETFGSGLCYEKGPQLLAHAAKAGVDAMIPDSIKVISRIGTGAWCEMGDLMDLRTSDGWLYGKAISGNGPLWVRCDYFTDKGAKAVLTGEKTDAICAPIKVGNILCTPSEIEVYDLEFSYPVGFRPDSPDAGGFVHWVTPKVHPK